MKIHPKTEQQVFQEMHPTSPTSSILGSKTAPLLASGILRSVMEMLLGTWTVTSNRKNPKEISFLSKFLIQSSTAPFTSRVGNNST